MCYTVFRKETDDMQNKKKDGQCGRPSKKRSREGSNLRPTVPQTVALSTELRDHELARWADLRE